MKQGAFYKVAIFTVFAPFWLQGQSFRVQLAAYSERQPDAFFKEKGIDYYEEAADKAGIYWYAAGLFPTREAAEVVLQDVISKGFAYAFIIDEEEKRVLSGQDCPYIRDGVVFKKATTIDSLKHTIYFDEGQSGLPAAAKAELDMVYRKMKEKPARILKIKGFTDGLGDGEENLKLAASRSRSARDYLIFKGV